jgi:uncharacterized membrane protein
VATLLVARRVVAVSGGVRAVEVSALAGGILLEWLVLVVVPMLVTRVAGAWIVVATWRLWRPIVGLVAPAVRGLGAAAGAINAGTQGPDGGPAPDELRLVVDEAHRDGRIEGAARDMIRGVIGLDQVKVAQIMTPRTRMVSIPLADGWDGAVRRATESGHTRLPVYDRSSDDVVGILHTRDLLTRGIPQGIPSILITVAATVSACVMSGIWTFTQGWRPFGGTELLLVACAAVFVSAGFYLIVASMRQGEMSVIGPFRYTGLLVALVLGFAIWGDIPNLMAWAGIALMMASGLYILLGERRRARAGA